MKRKPKKIKKYSKAHKEHRDKILNGFLRGDKLYIKNTGIRVKIESYSENNQFKNIMWRFHISVKTIDVPTVEALNMFQDFRLNEDYTQDKTGQHKTVIKASGQISILNISLVPFDTEAGKALYGN